MVLIFEGADLVGKTTLAKLYAVSLQLPILRLRWDSPQRRISGKFAQPGAELETIAFAKATIGLLAATRSQVILDRSFITVWAYRSDSDFMVPLLQALAELPDVRLLVLVTDDDTLRRRFQRAPDWFFNEEEILAANRRFLRLSDYLPKSINTLRLDTGLKSVEACCAAIDKWLGVTPPTQNAEDDGLLERKIIPIGELPIEIWVPRRPSLAAGGQPQPVVQAAANLDLG